MHYSYAIHKPSATRSQLLIFSILATALLFETRGLVDDERTQVLGSKNASLLQHQGAGLDVLAATADVAAGRSRLDHPDEIALDPADLDRNDRIGRRG